MQNQWLEVHNSWLYQTEPQLSPLILNKIQLKLNLPELYLNLTEL